MARLCLRHDQCAAGIIISTRISGASAREASCKRTIDGIASATTAMKRTPAMSFQTSRSRPRGAADATAGSARSKGCVYLRRRLLFAAPRPVTWGILLRHFEQPGIFKIDRPSGSPFRGNETFASDYEKILSFVLHRSASTPRVVEDQP